MLGSPVCFLSHEELQPTETPRRGGRTLPSMPAGSTKMRSPGWFLIKEIYGAVARESVVRFTHWMPLIALRNSKYNRTQYDNATDRVRMTSIWTAIEDVVLDSEGYV